MPGLHRARLGRLLAGLGFALGTPVPATAGQDQEVPSFAQELPPVKSGEPILKFNGKDLTGFYSYLHEHKYEDPNKVFTVHDGMIRISGQEFGGLTTRDEFHDYHLVTEW